MLVNVKKSHRDACSRRGFLAAGAAAVASTLPVQAAPKSVPVVIFSKHLQFLRGEELAAAAAELGYDGVDLTVRKGGHVEPARVREDLPRLVAAIRKHGLETPTITTDIVDTQTPYIEDILRTMADLGIARYRWGGFTWDAARPYGAQIEEMKMRVARLAAVNQRYRVCAMYHTHSGIGVVGANIWDLYVLLKDYDPNAVAVNFDIGHATVEGGFGGWINSLRISLPRLRGAAVKDFVWARESSGEWRPKWAPLGEGMVDFAKFFQMLKQAKFEGPLQVFFEYPLGGANDGAAKITIPKEEVYAAMRKDLARVRQWLAA
jgi:sugar phosphate isomerase/epimerase